MNRPKPTKPLLMDLCGANSHLIECVHHGLDEVSLAEVYPILDLDEAIGFAASSWKTRSMNPNYFNQVFTPENLHALFSDVLKIGIPWLRKHKDEGIYANPLYQALNPFKGEDLSSRLGSVSRESASRLLEALKEPTMKHVFECQYHNVKAAQQGDNSNIKIMHFQNVFPRKEKIAPAYAAEIARILKSYPRAYGPENLTTGASTRPDPAHQLAVPETMDECRARMDEALGQD